MKTAPPTLDVPSGTKPRSSGLKTIFTITGIAWLLEIIDHIPGIHLDQFGVVPRSIDHLLGVFAMPWLHGGFGHLTSNTVTFIPLAYLTYLSNRKSFASTSLAIIILSGIGTWLIGRPNSIHIGASGLVYGYFGYLLTRSFLEKKFLWAIFGFALSMMYGSLIFGIIPSWGRLSWEGHLAGLITGMWLAKQQTSTNNISEPPKL